MPRLLLADDHAMFRQGLRSLIERESDFEIVAEASTGPECLERAARTRPDVLLLDVGMPGSGALETLQRLRRLRPRPRVLVLTVHPEDHYALRCLKAGADGYLTKDKSSEELLAAVRRLSSGGRYLPEGLTDTLLDELGGSSSHPYECLSNREIEVLRMLGAGRSVGEIASTLYLSAKTVSTYRSRICKKLGLENTAEIMRLAVREGLVDTA